MNYGTALRGLLFAVFIFGSPGLTQAQYDVHAPEPLPPLEGTLFLHGGGTVDSEMRQRFTKFSGGNEARIVVIPTADTSDPLNTKKLEVWQEHQPKSVEFLHAESRDQLENLRFEELLENASGIWFSGGKQSRLIEIYAGTKVEEGITRLLARGGVVGGTSAGAAIASKVMLVYDELRSGFDFLPGTIVDQHFFAKKRTDRLRHAVELHPARVGFGIDEKTALIVRGRRLEVMGDSNVMVTIAASANRPARTEMLKPGMHADLIALRRAAQSRQAVPFPSQQVITPNVPHGSLFIAGGGSLPAKALQSFVELAGGENAKIVYIPCEESKNILQEPSMVGALRNAGAGQVEWLHTKDRSLADDAKFIAKLETATGVWFGGGRQWNLVDSYQNTEAHRLMHLVLECGGAIGGSSAGASIQGDYMPRGDPMGNSQMMAEGYEQGLGFLRGVAIDQHFSQRNRFPDMALLKKTHPQLLGIGIDEGTCLVVKQSKAEIIGPGQVAFFDRPIGSEEIETFTSVKAGEVYDLASRKLIAD